MLTPERMDEIEDLVLQSKVSYIENKEEEMKALAADIGITIEELKEWYEQAGKNQEYFLALLLNLKKES